MRTDSPITIFLGLSKGEFFQLVLNNQEAVFADGAAIMKDLLWL